MSEKTSKSTCVFCGQGPDVEKNIFLLETENASICNECVDHCSRTLKELGVAEPQMKEITEFASISQKPSEIVAFLDQYVVGQEKAKKHLAVGIINHYKLLEHKQQEEPDVDLQKSNILMVGPTGSGKTLLVSKIAKILSVPFAIADATSLTEAGYVGNDVETVLRVLLENAGGDVEQAERGIIYIDEIDKLSRKGANPSITRDVSGEGVQQALLKMIEGAEIEVPQKGMRKHPTGDTFKINTENILFIVGGSFEGIEKIISKRMKKDLAGIGFGAKVESKENVKLNDYILDVIQEDLKNFGVLPELLGRLPIIAPLKELDRESLRKIITEPRDAIYKQYQELFRYDGIELVITEDGIDAIADLAIARGTGARSLRSIMEEALIDDMYTLPDIEGVKKVVFNAEAIRKESVPYIEYGESAS